MFDGLTKNGYGAILADPPWTFRVWADSEKSHGSAAAHYSTMSADELKAMTVSELAADDCCLFMWICWPIPRTIRPPETSGLGLLGESDRQVSGGCMTDWWKGKALSQSTHASINAANYPGTRQLCCNCDQPTERCEDDSIYYGDTGPLCTVCYDEIAPPEAKPIQQSLLTGDKP